MTWAFAQKVHPSSLKFLLVSLCDNADDCGRAFPSIACLVEKTAQDRKTVIKGLERLEAAGFIEDTGKRVGRTQQIKVYRVNINKPVFGTVSPREEGPKSTESGTVRTSENSTKNGTVTEGETVPFFPVNSPVFPSNSTVFPRKESQKRYTEPSWNPQEPSGNHIHGASEVDARKNMIAIRSAYPRGSGRIDWLTAEHHLRVRIHEGQTWDSIAAAVRRYAAWCEATGKIGTQFVMAPTKFFSAPDEPWNQSWDLPASKGDARLAGNISAAEEFIRRTEVA